MFLFPHLNFPLCSWISSWNKKPTKSVQEKLDFEKNQGEYSPIFMLRAQEAYTLKKKNLKAIMLTL